MVRVRSGLLPKVRTHGYGQLSVFWKTPVGSSLVFRPSCRSHVGRLVDRVEKEVPSDFPGVPGPFQWDVLRSVDLLTRKGRLTSMVKSHLVASPSLSLMGPDPVRLSTWCRYLGYAAGRVGSTEGGVGVFPGPERVSQAFSSRGSLFSSASDLLFGFDDPGVGPDG